MSNRAKKDSGPIAVALCAPAVRMVVVDVCAWSYGDTMETEHTIRPVVAIQSTTYRGGGTCQEALTVGEDQWICSTEELSQNDPDDGSTQTKFQVVVCSWPTEEDEERLAGIIEQLKKFTGDSVANRIALNAKIAAKAAKSAARSSPPL